jgi:TRAP-type mannitol/chloroaromatic compound transport system substrate-binding protein
MGFHKIAPYYYTGWHEPATELQFMINKKKWDKLPEDLQEILRISMRTASYDMYIQSYHESAANWETMLTDFPNIKVKTFPKPVMDAMKKANDELIVERAAQSPLAKKIIDSQAAYLKKARVWTNISDRAYLDSLDD